MRKRLNEMIDLAGQHETITVMDFRHAPGDILQQVKMGKTFSITKNKEVVAVLSRPEPTAAEVFAAVRRLASAATARGKAKR